MNINNVDKYKNNNFVKIEAEKNYSSFNRSVNTLTELKSNDKMLTNIQHMKNKLSNMLASGRVSTGDIEHKLLESALDQAANIQLKTQKSMDDVVDFYFTYNNFQDISSRMGENK